MKLKKVFCSKIEQEFAELKWGIMPNGSLCARGNLWSILNNITMYLHIYWNN